MREASHDQALMWATMKVSMLDDGNESGDINLAKSYIDLRVKIVKLFDKIKHGDDEHKKWLQDALIEHFGLKIARNIHIEGGD